MSRRRSRLAARRLRGLQRPGEIWTTTANLASVSSRPETVREILKRVRLGFTRGTYGVHDLDLCLLVECGDVTIRNLVDEGVWQTVQFGRSISDEGERVARSGCAILARRSTVQLDKIRLTLGSPAGEGIRDRYVLHARATFHPGTPAAWRTRVRVGHAPPGRAPIGRARFLELLANLFGIRGMDGNVSAETARRVFRGARVHSAGVMHVVVPRWMPSRARRRDVGSDHAALDVALWPRRKRGDA